MSITVDEDYVGTTTPISTSGSTAVNYVDVPLTTANSGTGYNFNSRFYLQTRDVDNVGSRIRFSAVNSSGTNQTLWYQYYYSTGTSFASNSGILSSYVNITTFLPDDYGAHYKGQQFLISTIPNTWAANNSPSIYIKAFYNYYEPTFQEWYFQPPYSETVGPPNVTALRFSVGGTTSGSTLYSLYPAL